jgi:hypothetical protein
MIKIVTRFTNKKNHIDDINKKLKQAAFIPVRCPNEISVVCIDSELKQNNSDKIIFDIGNLIYKKPPNVKARGDMEVSKIENITYKGTNISLEHKPSRNIPNHYNIKPYFEDLEFATNCAHYLSEISTLVTK